MTREGAYFDIALFLSLIGFTLAIALIMEGLHRRHSMSRPTGTVIGGANIGAAFLCASVLCFTTDHALEGMCCAALGGVCAWEVALAVVARAKERREEQEEEPE